jgi:competence protein ComEC
VRYQPLVPAAMAFVAGILVAEYAGGGMLVWCVATVVAAAVWAALFFLRAAGPWSLVALVAVAAAAGAACYRAAIDPAPADIGRLVADGRRMGILDGIVVRSARQSSPPADVFLPTTDYYTRTTLTLDCRRVRLGDQWHEAAGRVQAVVRQPLPEDGSLVPALGDRVEAVGALLPLGRPSNPGSFDVGGYLRAQGIRASFRTDHWEALRVVEPGADRLRAVVAGMQAWAVGRLDGLPTEEGRAIAAAMLFGRKDLLDFDAAQVGGQDLEHAFLATGTVHYMAVSGFNVAMVVAPVVVLLRLLGVGRRIMAVVVAAVVLAFVLMTELEPPVLRAAILFWVVCAGWLLGREALNLNTLAAAVLTVLVLRPGDLFSTSFQLSFLAVLGMMFLVDRLEGDFLGRFREARGLAGRPRGGFWYRLLRGTLIVSVAATLVTAPLIAYRFHVLAWTAPLASAILLPLVFVLTVAGMALVAVGWVAPAATAALAIPVDALGRLIAEVVRGMAGVPGSYFYVGGISVAWVLAAYALVALWVWRGRLRLSGRRVALAGLAAAAVFVWTTGHRAPQSLRATFLAVGSGNTTLLEFPGGRNVLYDAGSSLSHVRAAETAIAPALWARGIDRVDAIVLSHPHFDHFKDILPLVDRFGVRQVFLPPTFMRQRLNVDNGLVEALAARGVEVGYLSAGDRLAGLGPADVRAVWPRGPASQGRAVNDGSLVLAVESGGRRLLLTGDLMPAGDLALLAADPDLRADVMLWPHHGHEPVAVGRLAQRLGAQVLVISAGRPLAPAPPPAWLREAGMTCYHTGESGAVTVDLLSDGPRVRTFCPGPVAGAEGEEAAPESAEGQDN